MTTAKDYKLMHWMSQLHTILPPARRPHDDGRRTIVTRRAVLVEKVTEFLIDLTNEVNILRGSGARKIEPLESVLTSCPDRRRHFDESLARLRDVLDFQGVPATTCEMAHVRILEFQEELRRSHDLKLASAPDTSAETPAVDDNGPRVRTTQPASRTVEPHPALHTPGPPSPAPADAPTPLPIPTQPQEYYLLEAKQREQKRGAYQQRTQYARALFEEMNHAEQVRRVDIALEKKRIMRELRHAAQAVAAGGCKAGSGSSVALSCSTTSAPPTARPRLVPRREHPAIPGEVIRGTNNTAPVSSLPPPSVRPTTRPCLEPRRLQPATARPPAPTAAPKKDFVPGEYDESRINSPFRRSLLAQERKAAKPPPKEVSPEVVEQIERLAVEIREFEESENLVRGHGAQGEVVALTERLAAEIREFEESENLVRDALNAMSPEAPRVVTSEAKDAVNTEAQGALRPEEPPVV
ncbi:hypothetical protein C8R43DRAFT_1126319 [Mycena crocata]|nr:hypothetical protein C8R43DRAFT_1126319 [Mycena crocata]